MVAAVADRRPETAESGGHRPPPQEAEAIEVSDEGAPVGPSESEEVSFLAEQRAAAIPESLPVVRRAATDEDSGPPLPSLDKLVGRIPAATREVMDELFRARFVTVKRIPKSALK